MVINNIIHLKLLFKNAECWQYDNKTPDERK